MRRYSRFFAMFGVALSVFLFGACGSDEPVDTFPLDTFDPTVPTRLPMADEATFDVDWARDVLVASEADVMADIDDLNAQNGVFRVRAGSPLLEGVSVGSTVVWPQVGVLSVLSLTPEGERVAVGTEWALFADAMTRADIQFDHRMRNAGPGTVLGVAPSEVASMEGGLQQPLFDSPVVRFTEGGVSYDGGTWKVQLESMGDDSRVKFSSSSGAFASEVDATIRGLQAQGRIEVLGEDAEPTTSIVFPNVDVTGTAKVRFEYAAGNAQVIPPVTLVFPFMIGPLPAFVAMEVRVAVASTVAATSTMEASVDFDMSGTLTLSRGPEGFGIDGGITRFETSNFGVQFESRFTVGASIDFDAPRFSFGLGRPGIATAALYATLSAEAVANVVVDPAAEDYCVTASAGTTVLYGGEVSALGFSYGSERMLGGLRSPVMQRGGACMGP
jgi:hypothetical protein